MQNLHTNNYVSAFDSTTNADVVPNFPPLVEERDKETRFSFFAKEILERETFPFSEISPEIMKRCKAINHPIPTLDFGPKHTNIIKLDTIVHCLNLQGILVPLPFGIASEHMEQFFKKAIPSLFDHWKELGDNFQQYKKQSGKEDSAEFLQKSEVISLLEEIKQEVHSAFKKAIHDADLQKLLFPDQDLDGWIKKIQEIHHYLMVRSTGDEDSKTSANAGGNASVSYVKPTLEDIFEALAAVEASYFDIPSLKNRLQSGIDPFSKPLKIAATTQELIGEPVAGEKDPKNVPVSAVLFTNEPYYVGNEEGDEFRVMRISSTFGHGEGVVGNQGIASDTILLLQSRAHPSEISVIYQNKEKTKRLAPMVNTDTGKIELQKIANHEELVNKRTLDPSLLVRLFELGLAVEGYYERPADMELVIKNDLIYLVQERPVNRQIAVPTYFDTQKANELFPDAVIKSLENSILVPGLCSTLLLTSPEEILCIDDTLEQAEKKFVKGKHKLVIVSHDEPANSHPVVNFSSMGIPCLYSRDSAAAQEMANQVSSQKRLIVCTQQGTITLWDQNRSPAEDFITSGYISHPANLQISLNVPEALPSTYNRALPVVPQDLKNILHTIKTARTNDIALEKFKELKALPYINTIAQEKTSLKERLITHKNGNTKTPEAILETLDQLDGKLQGAFRELEATLATVQKPKKLEILLHVKVIETLLSQNSKDDGAVGIYSLASSSDLGDMAKTLLNYQDKLPFPARLQHILLDGRSALSTEIKQAWEDFLLDMERLVQKGQQSKNTSLITLFARETTSASVSIEELERFQQMITVLRKAQTLPFWINCFFASKLPLLKTKSSLDLVFKELLKEFTRDVEAFVVKMQEKVNEVKSIKADLSLFADPITFESAFSRLEKITKGFSDPENQESFIELFEKVKEGSFASAIGSQMLNEIISTYDSAIKTMKASTQFEDLHKSKLFKKMLVPYFTLMKSLAEHLVEEKQLAMHRDWPLKRYTAHIGEILGTIATNQTHLHPCREFSVHTAVFGSNTTFERHLPQTLEDIFTLIHQNLLALVSANNIKIFKDELLQALPLPQIMKDVLGTSKSFRPGVQYLGGDVDEMGMTFRYNVPIQFHSATFQVRHEPGRAKEEAIVSIQFLGQNRDRWNLIEQLVSTHFSIGTLRHEKKPEQKAGIISFSWKIRGKEELERTFEEFNRMIEISLQGRVSLCEGFTKCGRLDDAIRYLLSFQDKEISISPFALRFIESSFSIVDPNLRNQIITYAHVVGKQLNATSLDDVITLFSTLINEECGLEQAITLVQDLSKGTDEANVNFVPSLLTLLIKKGHGIEQAVALGESWANSDLSSYAKSSVILDVFLVLVEKGHARDQAAAFLINLVKNDDIPAQKAASLLTVLIEKFPDWIDQSIIREWAKSSPEYVSKDMAPKLKQFIKKGHGIEQAVFIASEWARSSRVVTVLLASDIFLELSKAGYATEQAITMADEWISHSNLEIKAIGFQLREELAQKSL